MTAIEDQLLQTLLDLENTVTQMHTANPKPDLLPIFARLDDLAAQLPPDAPRDLRHYLQRKSYQKARVFLQEQAAA
jgi:hypothetical protein